MPQRSRKENFSELRRNVTMDRGRQMEKSCLFTEYTRVRLSVSSQPDTLDDRRGTFPWTALPLQLLLTRCASIRIHSGSVSLYVLSRSYLGPSLPSSLRPPCHRWVHHIQKQNVSQCGSTFSSSSASSFWPPPHFQHQ